MTLTQQTEAVFSRVANSAPISTHPARQLVLQTSELGTGAVKPLDKKKPRVWEQIQAQRCPPATVLSYTRLLLSPRQEAKNPLVVHMWDTESVDSGFGRAEQTRPARGEAGREPRLSAAKAGEGDGAHRPPPLR